ncbi:MAG: MFS transporter [Rubrobacteraceae bacterium]|mgnify:CR=1 FL=1|uniref:MFS transporter n=1 Tax=Rubrobacter naiadicus TaxID=1392641 RepID=UPI0023628641|nr:MFS transporter [Rubrobacter naiadicus]MCL6438813.1 MFS transporter [Rubrobacteraceae bacterium]
MRTQGTRITIASRLDRLPVYSMHRRLIAVLGVGTFFDLYDIFLGGVLAAVLADTFNLGTTGKALVIGSGFVGMFFGASVLGIVSDYVGRRAMYQVDLLIYSIFSLAAAFAPSLALILIFRFLGGLGLGATLPMTDIYMGEMVPRRVRGRFTALAYTIGFFGVPVAGLAGRLLAPNDLGGIAGWRWLFVFGSLGAFIVWFMRRSLPESPRWYEIKGRPLEAEAAMRRMEEAARRERGIDELPAPEPAPVEPQREATFREIFDEGYARRTVMLFVFQILQTVGYYGFGSLAPIVLTDKGFDIVETLGYTALIFLGYPIGSMVSVPVVERFERKWIIVGSAILMAILGMVFGFASSVPVIVLSGFLLTAVSNLFSNAFHIYQAEIFPTRMRGTAVGTAYSLSRLTSAVLPFVAVPFLAAYGPAATFIGSAVILGILCLDVGILGPRSTGRTLEKIAR